MNRFFQFAIFFVVFLSAYGLMNYYVYLRLSKILNFRYLWMIILALAVCFPLVSFLERIFDGLIIGIFYFFTMTWVGVAFFLLFSFLIMDAANFFFKFNYQKIGFFVLGIVFLITLFSLINAQITGVKKIDVSLKNLPKGDIKIVQLSDIHVGTVHKEGFLKKLVQMTNEQKPDIVVITGDLFDGSGPLTDQMLSPMKKFNAPVYFVTGNHEIYLGRDKAVEMVEKNNITVLSNKAIKIKGIQLVGLESPLNELDNKTTKLEGIKLDKNMTKVVLYHIPIFQEGADLQLSGHTHNGQIFPFTLFVLIPFKFVYGLYSVGDSYIYVTSGVGTWGPPMRFLAPSEIVVVNLKKSQ